MSALQIDPDDVSQMERLRDYLADECDWFGMGEDHTIPHLQAALRSLVAPPKRQVYSHIVADHRPNGISIALCGKVWRVGEYVHVLRQCPSCGHLAEGWVA